MSDRPTLEHFDAAGAKRIANEVIVPIYEASHRDDLSDPFYSTERFLERFDAYTLSHGFEAVVAHVGAEPVGLAFGFTLSPTAAWWRGLTTPVADGLVEETGERTFAVNEIMVHPDWQRRGIARAAHDELVHNRPEERATLLVDPENATARAAYDRWGYQHVGTLHPFPDAPFYDAMVLPLR